MHTFENFEQNSTVHKCNKTSMIAHERLVYRGWFEPIYESLENSSDSSRQHIFKNILRNIVLIYHESVCCIYSLEPPHRGNSNENTQRTFIL